MSFWLWKTALAGGVVVAVTAYSAAQMPPGPAEMHGPPAPGSNTQMMPPGGTQGPVHGRMMQMMQYRTKEMAGQPTMPGQDAFGAIQETVSLLEADPATDWSKVNIAALREHLIDMRAPRTMTIFSPDRSPVHRDGDFRFIWR